MKRREFIRALGAAATATIGGIGSTTTIDRLRSAAISTGVTRRSRSQRKFGN